MKKSIPYYKMTLLAAVILLGLIFIQVNWLNKATALEEAQQQLKLLQLAPSIAQAIDQTERKSLHHDGAPFDIDTANVENIIDSIMTKNNYIGETIFAIFQDTIGGAFVSNGMEYRDALLQSNTRQCLSCYMSFSMVKKDSLDWDNIDLDTFDMNNVPVEYTYSRPIDNYGQLPGSKSAGQIYWLSLHLTNPQSAAIKTLTNIFILSIGLILLLIFLFYYILKAFSEHKKMSQVKEDFFNNLSHEFKTPLSSIHLASRVLRKSTDPKKNKTYLDLIEKESKNLEERLTKVLELSLIDQKELHLSKELVNLHQIIKDLPNRFSVLSAEKKATISLFLNAKDVTIKGNVTQLSNCFYNLVENALKYGGDQVNIEITTSNQNGKKRITFKDNGPGIQPEHHQDIFDRFFRAQKNDQYKGQGFGIGLSYVKAIIEAYGGTVSINPNYRDGCEFIVLL